MFALAALLALPVLATASPIGARQDASACALDLIPLCCTDLVTDLAAIPGLLAGLLPAAALPDPTAALATGCTAVDLANPLCSTSVVGTAVCCASTAVSTLGTSLGLDCLPTTL
ncbi:hypothetical protein PHLGIDRAFT_122560 [Phlebiopsis gigantea 11061_1 CR5-6]|uniref:Hydrophobin n=1 Tax=Phlebiopsis gigantea (strain 11061_1 CR5-6) TaxID=745531 RepID=A0A0C3PBJ9_PHLG1|nr:hypothetical protein PHLGIDRAFT_122560 [Phlebiopsis gigantea 11061_1 CR5-6]